MITVEAKYPINFTMSRRTFCLNLHYNGSNSFLFVNATKLYQFKSKDRIYCLWEMFQKTLQSITSKSTNKLIRVRFPC